MKSVIALLAFVMVAQANAQNGQGYVQGETVVVPAPNAEVQSIPGSSSGNPIYILNNQRQQGYQGTTQTTGQTAIQEQPVSVIQEAPLRVSPAENMRRKRQESEAATEDGIVQALERARIEDEMRRRDKFNSAINTQANGATVVGDNNTVQQTNVVAQQQQIQEVVTVPVAKPKKKIHVVEEESDESDFEIVETKTKSRSRGEISTSIGDYYRHDDFNAHTYISGLVSYGAYDNVLNMRGNVGGGFAFGMVTADRIVAEGSFLYGQYEIENLFSQGCGGCGVGGYGPMIVDMTQYNFVAAAKYQILPGKFRPVAGAALSYTRRSYSYEFYNWNMRTSDALDVGGIVGADLQISQGFAIGLDFRYFTNLGYRQNSERRESFTYRQDRNDPEKLDYYQTSLTGKFTF